MNNLVWNIIEGFMEDYKQKLFYILAVSRALTLDRHTLTVWQCLSMTEGCTPSATAAFITLAPSICTASPYLSAIERT